MKAHGAFLAAVAVTALALAPACRNTAEGMKEDVIRRREVLRVNAGPLFDDGGRAACGASSESMSG